jgi:hypothetical protein
MTLTSQLRDASSPLARLFAAELPDVDALLDSYRSRLPARPPTVRPCAPAGAVVPWATIGTAIDLRLRWSLTNAPSQDRAVEHGVSLAATVESDAPHWPGLTAGAALGAAGRDLLQGVARLLDRSSPWRRGRPALLPAADEELLDRACFLLAEYVELYRAREVGPVLDAACGRPGPVTAAGLLAAVPAYIAADLAAMVARADAGLDAVRRGTLPGEVIPGPQFAGSAAVGNADGDWVAAGLLADVKATVHPERLGPPEVWQLAGYALLDWDDQYGIDRVGWYLARQGLLPAWDLEEYLTLLGSRRTVGELRRVTAAVLGGRPVTAPSRAAGGPAPEPGALSGEIATGRQGSASDGTPGRRSPDRRPAARGCATVVPGWVAAAVADIAAARRVAAGWYRVEPDRRWEGGFAATLDWLLGAGPAPVSRRPDPVDYGTVLAEAGTADAVLYRTSRASVLTAVMCGIEGGEPMTAVHAGGVTVPIPAAVVTDDEWADGALEACMWLLGLTGGCPLLLPVRPAPTVEQRYDALCRDPQYVGTPRVELWVIAAAQAEANRMAIAFADGVPAVLRRTPPPMPPGLA